MLRVSNRRADFNPKTKFVLGALFEALGDELDRRDDFLKEYLEDGVRPGEPSAHVPRSGQQVFILNLQTFLLGLTDVRRPLLGQDFIVRSENEVNVILKLAKKALECR